MRKFIRILRDAAAGGEGEGGTGGEPGTVAKATPDHQPPNPPAPFEYPEINMQESLPPELRDDPNFKDMTFERLVTDFQGLQKKIGERPPVGVPAPDAKPEEVQAFYEGLRPENSDNYEFPTGEGVDENFQAVMKDLLFKSNISTHQAKTLIEGYDQFQKQQQETMETEFDKKIDELYKDQRDQVLSQTKQLMKDNIPQEMHSMLENLPNSSLLLLTATMKSIHDKYIKEDSLPGHLPKGGDNPVELRAEAMKIMQTDAYKDFRQPGHEDARAKVKELYAKVAELQKQS